ncbi:methyltransferase family protein [Pseudonocardia sp.]|uniref:methyltransferase family protein n=1 Tax=Pseudonocardia sp. TaxID=60912 RepID=UPI003BEF05C9
MDPPKATRSIRAMADLATPMSIRVAATLSLVERAGSAGATAEQLASETGTATPAIRCLLDHLVTIGVFDLDVESSHYRPTNLGAQLSEDALDGIKPLLDINSAGGRAELAFVELLGTCSTTQVQWQKGGRHWSSESRHTWWTNPGSPRQGDRVRPKPDGLPAAGVPLNTMSCTAPIWSASPMTCRC